MSELKCAKCRRRFCQEGIRNLAVLPLFCPIKKAPKVVKDRYTGHNPVISLYTKYHEDIV